MPPPPTPIVNSKTIQSQPSGSFRPSDSTPIKSNLGEYLIAELKEVHAVIDYAVSNEMKPATVTEVKNLVEVKFPDDCFGFDIHECTKDILDPTGNKGGLYRSKHWVDYPTASTPARERERIISDLFNNIGRSIMKSAGLGKELVRTWTSRFSSSAIPHERCSRRPDIALLNTKHIKAASKYINWSLLFGNSEVKFGTTVTSAETHEQLSQTTRLTFGAQPDRRFVLGISLVNSNMSLVVFNRGFMLASETFDIHKNPERLVRIMAGFMFADRKFLGFDPSMEVTEVDGQCSRTVTVNSNVYDIEDIIHVEDVVRGRATVCLKVTRNGGTYVVKDAWVDPSRQMKEPELMKKLDGVEGVPQLIEHEIVKIDGAVVSTFIDIEALSNLNSFTEEQGEVVNELDLRERVRTVLSPFGRRIRAFKSIRELFQAFIDVVNGMFRLDLFVHHLTNTRVHSHPAITLEKNIASRYQYEERSHC